MLATTVEYFSLLNLQFNPTKTFAIHFGVPMVSQYDLKIKGVAVAWVEEVKYLGIILNNMFDHEKHIRRTVCDVYARSNAIFATFSRFHRNVQLYLFETYCCSLYGILCCSIADNNLHSIHVAWNKVIRRIFGLPFKTHTSLLPQIIGRPHVKFKIFHNFIKFAFSLLKSKNPVLRSVAEISSTKLSTVFGGNLFYVLSRYEVTNADFVRYNERDVRILLKRITAVDTADYRAGFIRELLAVDNIDRADSKAILEYLCCA
jgi:hypothetical protein